jgi:hypothetical protein
MLDLSNVTENVFGAIQLLRFENLTHMPENSSELRNVFGMDHDIGRLVDKESSPKIHQRQQR